MKCILAVLLVTSFLYSAPASAQQKPTDEWLTRPVDDRTFRTYLDFFQYDRRLPLELRSSDVQSSDIRVERISFQSTPGIRATAILYRPLASAASGNPAIILLHGGGGPGKDGRPMTVVAELLTRGGFTVLSMDMQYFGERKTDLLQTFSEDEKHDRLYNQPAVHLAWVTQTTKDVGRAVDYLVQHAGVSENRIGLVGFSRGAISATIAGAVERRLNAVVLFYGGHFDAKENGHLPAACPANYVGRISPRPLLMINGVNDPDMIRDTSVLPLFRVGRMPKEIIWEDAGHQLPGPENLVKTLHWLRDKLKGS